MTNKTKRVFELLKRFNNGEIVCIETLQSDPIWYGKSEKTIRRDLDVIKKDFSLSYELIRGAKGEKGCYKAITKDMFNNFMDKDMLSLMVQTFNIAQRSNLFESLNISDADKQIINRKIEKSKECYEFITKPYESKKNDAILLREIERAISWKRYSIIEYEKEGTITKHDIKPYKIVFMNENFYLCAQNSEGEFIFSNFRLSETV